MRPRGLGRGPLWPSYSPTIAGVARNWHADGTTGAGIAGGGDQQAPDQRFSVETMGFEPTTPCLQSRSEATSADLGGQEVLVRAFLPQGRTPPVGSGCAMDVP